LAAALRSGSTPKIVAAPALHLLRPPTADRSGFQKSIFRHLGIAQSILCGDGLCSQTTSHPQRDETGGNYMAAAEMSMILRVGSNRTRRFRSLSKAFDKERYAKVEVMSSSLVNRVK
jgi:hypothetical protein